MKYLYLKLFDGCVYGGPSQYRYLVRLGVKPDSAVSGYACVDNDAIARKVEEIRQNNTCSSPEDNYVLSVGRLIEKKNWLRVLVAFREYVVRIKPEKQPWKLVIAGDGPMRHEIEEQIRNLDLNELVVMMGQVDSFEEVVRLNALSKVLILASHHNEQWGLVVNEAMAAARPVLVSQKCGCVEELVRDGKNGFTFDPYSTQDIAEKLLWMHRNEDRLDEMGRCSRQIIENFSPIRFAEKVKALYERPGQRQW